MDISKLTREALEKAYAAQVINLYNVYLNALTTAESEDTKKEALERFKKGLKLAQKALKDTLELVGNETKK